jgi:peptidylprolyl isomerase domain and WD repeat-containing protein 1
MVKYYYFFFISLFSRMAAERDLEKSEAINLGNVIFDENGYFVLYATLLGVKVVNLYTNKCVKTIGKPENLRPLKLALYQVSMYIV